MSSKIIVMPQHNRGTEGRMKYRTLYLALVVLCCCAAHAQGPTITGLLVNGVSSNVGPIGATLTIQGSGFGATMGFSIATMNGVPVAGAGVTPISWSNTSIVAAIPSNATSGPVIVTVGGTKSNSVSFFIGPVITSISPTSQLVGKTVTINGQGFGTSAGTVTFNGLAATAVWADTIIYATVPTGVAAGPIVVTASGQASNGMTFTPTPSISGLSSTSGVPGNNITISGNSFGNAQPSSNVTFDGVAATVNSWTNTNIGVSVPAGGTTGNVVVSVNAVSSAGVMFTYVPSITSLSPIPVRADGLITIGGSYFGAPMGTDAVTFNGIAATINSWSNKSISALVPPNVKAGTVVVSVNSVSSNSYSFSLESPYAFSLVYAPDGDVLTANDNINGNWVYAYDDFNRLSCSNLSSNGSCASPTSGTATYTYAYDQYGNRWQQNGPFTMLLTFSNSQNRMDGYSYDAAGNLLNDGNHNYVYDAENRVIQVDPGPAGQPPAYAYAYDGDGLRIQKQSLGVVVAEYLHDLGGNTITEINSSGVWTRSEIYAGGRHLATYGGGVSGMIFFVQQDWLGTERARVLPDGDVSETCTSLPFGDGQTCTGSADPTPTHFTGKERDSESGLDVFGARYYGSSLGRFITPDWAAKPVTVPYAHFGNPQSLNLYSYVVNNPTTTADPDGHCPGDTPNCQKLATNPLSSVSAETKQAINNSVQASNSPSGDDKKGGSHEEGGISYTKNGVQVNAPAQPGKYQDVKTPGEAKIDPFKAAEPSHQKPGDVKADVEWHIHPSASITETSGSQSAPGTVVFGGTTTTTTYQFNQPPSGVDIQEAGGANLSIVVGARDKTVYVYDSSGCTCKESLKDFNKTPNQ